MPYEVTEPSLREHLSFSQLSLAASCGEAYRLRYIEGESGGPTNVPALVGSGLHAAVLDVEEHIFGKPTKIIDWEQAEYVLAQRTKDHVRNILREEGITGEDLVYFGKQDLPFFLRQRIPEMSAIYLMRRREELEELGFRWAFPTPAESIEVACIVDIGGKKFLAYIDQVFIDSKDRVVIRDLKTGKPKDGHAMQLEQYRLALKRSHGVDANYGQLLYLGEKKKPVLEVVKWQLDDRQVESATARLVHTINDGVFLVNGPFTGACTLCDYTPTCPYGAVATR